MRCERQSQRALQSRAVDDPETLHGAVANGSAVNLRSHIKVTICPWVAVGVAAKHPDPAHLRVGGGPLADQQLKHAC